MGWVLHLFQCPTVGGLVKTAIGLRPELDLRNETDAEQFSY